jgi:hypothetical protein
MVIGDSSFFPCSFFVALTMSFHRPLESFLVQSTEERIKCTPQGSFISSHCQHYNLSELHLLTSCDVDSSIPADEVRLYVRCETQ